MHAKGDQPVLNCDGYHGLASSNRCGWLAATIIVRLFHDAGDDPGTQSQWRSKLPDRDSRTKIREIWVPKKLSEPMRDKEQMWSLWK